MMLAAATNAPCFDALRTKQQLGYIVWSFVDRVRGWLSFRVMVQSNVANTLRVLIALSAHGFEFVTCSLVRLFELELLRAPIAVVLLLAHQ